MIVKNLSLGQLIVAFNKKNLDKKLFAFSLSILQGILVENENGQG